MRIAAAVLARPITTIVVTVAVLMTGLLGVQRLPLAFLPEIDTPLVSIEVSSPGSSPREVLEEITEPIEEELATIDGVRRMHSSSRDGSAVIELEFSWGQSLDLVRLRVAEHVDRVRPSLPPRTQRVSISSYGTASTPVLLARVSAHEVDLSSSYALLEDHLLEPIRRVPGVARVELDGVAPPVVFVDLVHDRVVEHQLDVGELARRLQRASSRLVLGRVHQGGLRYSVRGVGAIEDLEVLRAVPIGVGDLRLRDVAEVRYEEPPLEYGRHLDGEFAVGLAVYKESTANTVEVVQQVLEVIEHDVATSPELRGIELLVWDDQAEQIEAGLEGLRSAGLLGFAMAVGCLLLFLRRLGPTIVIAISIPISIVATWGAMFVLGQSLNLLSMTGLMLAIGMLVDNAIVVVESIDGERQRGADASTAAVRGSSVVQLAVVAATATTLIVFLPLMLGADSELTTWLGAVATTISLTMSCSLLVALTLVPLLASWVMRRGAPPRPGRWWLVFEDAHARVVSWTLRRRARAAALLLGGLGWGLLPFLVGALPIEPFSGQVNDRLSLRYEFSEFHDLRETEDVVERVEGYLREHQGAWDIDDVYSWYGENEAVTVLSLARPDLDDDAIADLRERIREGLPRFVGGRVVFEQDAAQGGAGTGFSIHLYGRDLDELEAATRTVAQALEASPGLADVVTSFRFSGPELQVSVDAEAGIARGLRPGDVADVFELTLQGLPLPRFRDGTREAPTWLALRREDRAHRSDVEEIRLETSEGARVRLGELVSFGSAQAPRQIERDDRRVYAWVRGTHTATSTARMRDQIGARLDALALPSGVTWSWDRRAKIHDEQQWEMNTNFSMALVLIYVVLASLFESPLRPVAILVSIVSCLPGAAWILVLTDTPFNLMAQIGLLILLGVVVNNGVVLVERVGQLRAAGLDTEAAFVQAGRDRLRPICMTLMTTVVGLLPLAWGGSAVGGLFYFPLARTVIGGLVSAAVFTLVGLPLLTVCVESLRRVVTRRGRP